MSDNMYTITSFCSYVPITIVRWRLYTYCNFWILICDTSKCNLSYPCWRISSFNIIIWSKKKYGHDLAISIPWTFYCRNKRKYFYFVPKFKTNVFEISLHISYHSKLPYLLSSSFLSCPLIRGVINMVIFDYTYNENLSTDYDANLLWGRQGHWHHWLDIVLSYRTMKRKLPIRCFSWNIILKFINISNRLDSTFRRKYNSLALKAICQKANFSRINYSKVYNYTLFQTFLMNDKETDLLWWLW